MIGQAILHRMRVLVPRHQNHGKPIVDPKGGPLETPAFVKAIPGSALANLAPIDFSRGLIIERTMRTLLVVELEVGREA